MIHRFFYEIWQLSRSEFVAVLALKISYMVNESIQPRMQTGGSSHFVFFKRLAVSSCLTLLRMLVEPLTLLIKLLIYSLLLLRLLAGQHLKFCHMRK